MAKKQFSFGLVVATLFMSVFVAILFSPELFAATLTMSDGANSARGNGQPADLFGAAGVFTSISSLLLYLIGALSVIMIIFGGLRYVVSGGNAASITAARNTIIYAVVGIIIAILAYAMINFVLGSLVTTVDGTNV